MFFESRVESRKDADAPPQQLGVEQFRSLVGS
jgi:hypothetical protein